MKTSKLELQPYPAWLELRVTDKGGDPRDLGMTEDLGDGRFRMTLRTALLEDGSDPSLESVAVHEAVHVAQFLEKFIENELDMESEAYMVQRVFDWVVGKCPRK